MTPVGLFGLHKKTQPFFGIILIKSSSESLRFIVLKNEILQPASLHAASYSPKVGTGIKIEVFLPRNILQKL